MTHGRPLTRALPSAALALIPFLAAPALAQDQIPKSLVPLVKGIRHRTQIEVTLSGEEMRGFNPFSELPFLLWRDDYAKAAPFRKDVESVKAWLAKNSGPLGHRDFELEFVESYDWIGEDEVWTYKLVRKGIELYESRVKVHWQDDTFIGLVNDVQGRFTAIEELARDANPDVERIYFPVQGNAGEFELVLAEVTHDAGNGWQATTIQHSASVTLTSMTPLPNQGNATVEPQFKEWPVPVGAFPDQIDTDSNGRVWYSQPNHNRIARFNPGPETFTTFPVTAGNGPDGLIVSAADEVWSGLFYSGTLGRYDPMTGVHKSYPSTWSNPALAIPTEASDGSIWVTDHSGEVGRFDPNTEQWLTVYTTPTANPHIVAGAEDTVNQVMYFTEFNINRLGRQPLAAGAFTEIPIPGGGGPAFLAYDAGKIWYSLWNTAKLGCYDVATGQFTDYLFPIGNEIGGPMAISPNGDVIVGTRNQGYIMVYRPSTNEMRAYDIPQPNPGLKDGLTVAPDGTVWFTESFANRLARLKYPN